MYRLISFVACLLFLLTSLDSVEAQRRRSRRAVEPDEEKVNFADKINYEIRIGNIGFGGGFALDLKPSVGYKINKYITTGVGYRIDYDFINNFPNDFSLFSHGPFVLARGKFLQNFYLQGEYTFFNFDNFDSNVKQSFPSVGVGMVQGGDNWKYNLEVMFIADELSRDFFNNTVEFWFSFSKNF